MPVFGMFDAVTLGIGVIELTFLSACVLILVIGCIQRNRTVIVVGLAVPAAAFGLMFAVSEMQAAEDPFPNLTQPPTESMLPGIYVLDPGSYDDLRNRHFADFSATIVLNADKTFLVTQMPHIWVDGSPESAGYDSAAGRWEIGRSENNYNVTLMTKEKGVPEGAVFLDIKATKGNRKTYALEMPVFYGDFDYIYFVRKPD